MTERSDPAGRDAEHALTIFATASGALAALLILPYLQYLLLAIVLAYVLAPAQRTLERWLGPTATALSLVVVSLFVLLIPIAYVLTIAVRQGLELVTAIRADELQPDAIQDRLEAIGYTVDLELLYTTFQDPIAAGAQGVATGALAIVGGLPGVFVGMTVTVFVLFTLLRDGEQLLAWVRSVIPLPGHLQQELVAELDRLMWASVVGNVGVAVIQAVLLGIGLALVGMPGVIFLAVATFVLTLLPLVGAFGVWVPVTIYLYAIGRPGAAGTLAVYGLLVSGSDLYLRPALIGRSGTINVAIIVVGIFGGVALFGGMGLFIGPVVLGGAKIVIDLVAAERATRRAA